MKKRKKITFFALMLLCILAIFPMTASAAKLKKISLDRYLRKGKNYTLLAYCGSEKPVYIRTKKSIKAKVYPSALTYGGAVTVDKSKLKIGKKTAWIPVYVYNGRTRTTGYIQATHAKLSYIYTKRFSANKVINKALKTGIKYLGTPFVIPGSSLDHGIDCAQFVNAIYRAGGRNLVSWPHTNYLQAVCFELFYHRSNAALSKTEMAKLKTGDLLFYLQNDTSGPIDHVGVYIGNGFMINSSGHYGSIYPNGGVCIKRVQYGGRKIVRAMRVRGF